MTNKGRFDKRFANPSAEGGVPDFMKSLANIVDTKIVLARKLHKAGKTCAEMAGPLGYSSPHSVRAYLATLGLKPNVTPPEKRVKRVYTEEEKALRRERMVNWSKEHPTHQNDWRKPMEPRITYPKWHEEARKLREEGMSLIEIAKRFDVSASRVSQVTNENWEKRAENDRAKLAALLEKKKQEKQAMADRMFEKFHSKNPQEKRLGVIIRCSHTGCDKSDLFMRPGIINPTHAAQVFRHRGWHVAGGPRGDLCPEHAGNTKPAPNGSTLITPAVQPKQTMSPAIKVAEQVFKKPVPTVAVAPVETVVTTPSVKSTETLTPMTKADRRLIMQKLLEVYEDDNTSYKGEWTDEAVAKDMGCPIQWVEEIREDSFGPNVNKVLQQAALTAKQVEEVKALAQLVVTAKETVDDLLDKLATATEKFDKAVADFEEKRKALPA